MYQVTCIVKLIPYYIRYYIRAFGYVSANRLLNRLSFIKPLSSEQYRNKKAEVFFTDFRFYSTIKLLFPFDGCRRFGCNVVNDSVDRFDLVNYSRRNFNHNVVRDIRPVGSHAVDAGNSS